jgi:hypothetical protein
MQCIGLKVRNVLRDRHTSDLYTKFDVDVTAACITQDV